MKTLRQEITKTLCFITIMVGILVSDELDGVARYIVLIPTYILLIEVCDVAIKHRRDE